MQTQREMKEIKWDQIDINSLENLSPLEVIEIAKSIGIFKNNQRKEENIESIKELIQRKKETIEDEKKQLEINSFNKSPYKLEIKDGLDKQEIPFWLVFRNKVLFKHVMSFMDKVNSIPYDQITSVHFLIENGLIGIVKDKVFQNKLISFTNFIESPRKNNYSVFKSLFKTIKDDKEFYKAFFKNYNSIVRFNLGDVDATLQASDFDNNYSGIVELIILTNCKIALEVLIEEHDFKPTLQCLILAIKNRNNNNYEEVIKIVDYIIDPKFQLLKEGEKLNIKNVIGSENLMCSNSNSIEVRAHLIEYLVNIDGLEVPSNIENYKLCLANLFELDPLELKLRVVIRLLNLLDLLKLWGNQKLIPFPISKRDEINTFIFSEQQLESRLDDPINCFSNEKENIKVLNLIYSNMSRYGAVQHYYNGKYFYLYGKEEEIDDCRCFFLKDSRTIRFSIEYGKYKVLNKSKYTGDFDFLFSGYNDPIEDFKLLFKYNDNKQDQIEFIQLAVQDIKNEKGIPPIILFLWLVNFDDVKLVKKYIQLLKNNQDPEDDGKFLIKFSTKHSETKYSVSYYIKSIKMLDYIFQEFYYLIESAGNDRIQMNFRDLNLIKHFQTLFQTKYLEVTNKKTLNFNEILISNFNSVLIIQHVIDNATDYKLPPDFIHKKPYDFDKFDEKGKSYKEIYFSSLKKLITTVPNIKIYPFLHYGTNLINNIYFYPSNYFIDWLSWLYPLNEENKDEDRFYFKTLEPLLYYLTGRNDQLFSYLDQFITFPIFFTQLSQITELTKLSIIKGNIQLVDKIMKILFDVLNKYFHQLKFGKSTDYEIGRIGDFIMSNILMVAVANEKMLILDFLFSNYNQIFIKKSKPKSTNAYPTCDLNDGLFTQTELRELLFLSISSNYLETSKFLFKIYSITKKQFEQHCSCISYYNFKNKFLK